MDCCKNELGNFPHNADIHTGVFVIGGGDYIFDAGKINGTIIRFAVTITPSEVPIELIIPKGILNEDFYYCFTITDPLGQPIEENYCGNFCLKTYIETNITCGDTCPPPPEEEIPLL
jgi:hypothetical protein